MTMTIWDKTSAVRRMITLGLCTNTHHFILQLYLLYILKISGLGLEVGVPWPVFTASPSPITGYGNTSPRQRPPLHQNAFVPAGKQHTEKLQ